MDIQYELNREKDETLFCERDEDGVYPNHFHKKLELMYVTEGKKRLLINSKRQILSADEIFVADSYMLHAYLPSAGSKQTIIVFPNKYLEHYFSLYADEALAENVIRDKQFCASLLPYINEIATLSAEENPLLYQANVDMLLAKIVKRVGLRKKEFNYSLGLIGEVLEYIEVHYAEELTLQSLAEQFGYSKYYFSRIFNGALRTNLSEYVSLIRINKVLETLRRGEVKVVADAVFSCGFTSIATFYRAIKRNYTYKKIEDLL